MGAGTAPQLVVYCSSRNMAVVRRGADLVVVNSVRLHEAGLADLDALGRVTDVVRLAGGHGSDDPFYKDRNGATVWAVAGQTYFEGTNPRTGAIYFQADRALEPGGDGPLPGASLTRFDGTPPEGLLLLDVAGGTLLAGDSMQNWGRADAQFNWLGWRGFGALGFLRPHALGPGWLRQCEPARDQVRGVLDLDFENLVPAHGEVVVGGAREAWRPAIEAYASPG